MEKRYAIAALICCLASSLPLGAQEISGPQALPPQAEQDPQSGPPNAVVPGQLDLSGPADESSAFSIAGRAMAAAPKPLRFTTGQENSFRTQQDRGLVYNRSWFRIEFSKLFSDSFFVQFDSKLNAYWQSDHRAKAQNKDVVFESLTPEAFVQYSAPGGNTSIKVGWQRLIWGESQAGAITDEVSPRNYQELFFIPLEESRIGQLMLTLDHFSALGNGTFFFVPRPKFNEYPKPGTAYYYDPFNGLADIHDAPNRSPYELGTRWKKTFGQSDISFMAASLMDNDYVYRLDGITKAGRWGVSRLQQRFDMAGVTFNYSKGKYLLTGEVAYKSPKDFNDINYQIVKDDVVATSLGVTYSLGRSNTIGLEVVNNHIRGWNERIIGVARDTTSLVLNANLLFLSDNLSVNWLTVYTQPFTSYQSSIRTSYKWSDNVTFSLDTHFLGVPNKISPLYPNRGQGQMAFRVQFQF
jgi:hypothetical protein